MNYIILRLVGKKSFRWLLRITVRLPPTPITSQNAYFHILFGISGDMVDTTIVGGNILMEDREISGLDYERIVRRVKEQAEDFWKRF